MNKDLNYLVTGASGRVGSRVAKQLLSQGHKVRVFGRSREKLKSLVDLGATPVVGNLLDKESVNEAFDGVDAALLIAQGDRGAHDYRREFARSGENYAAALKNHSLKGAVFISSLGADDDRNRGLVLIHSDVERALNAVPDANIVYLRAPGFIENLYYFSYPLREFGILSWPVSTTSAVNMASARDVADVAVDYLLKLNFQGKQIIELQGKDVSMENLAELISKTTGKTIPAKPDPREANIEGMVAAGIGRDFSTLMNDTWEVFSRGLARRGKEGVSLPLPDRIEDFIRDELAPALQKA